MDLYREVTLPTKKQLQVWKPTTISCSVFICLTFILQDVWTENGSSCFSTFAITLENLQIIILIYS